MNNNPIGIFDSGVGGLTVAGELINALPNEDLIYLGDTARVPYGIRTPETVRRYAMEGAGFLIKKGIKLLVIACNTMSAVALDEVRSISGIPVIGVIAPGAMAAYKATKNRRIGVIGTEATIKSSAYEHEINANAPSGAEIFTVPCPLFVPLVEEGWLEGQVPELVAEKYLSALKHKGIDTLVLGCTHYPLLKSVISKAMGGATVLIDSAEETARQVRDELDLRALLNDSVEKGVRRFFVTDGPEKFRSVGERFLNSQIEHIKIAELEVD